MATETRHAAWQQRTYAVTVSPGETPTVLADGFDRLDDALDFAFDWLDDLGRGEEVEGRLVIELRAGGVTEEVWSLPPRPESGRALADIFGYNPLIERSSVRGRPGVESSRLSDRLQARKPMPEPSEQQPSARRPPPLRHAPIGPVEDAATPPAREPEAGPVPETRGRTASALERRGLPGIGAAAATAWRTLVTRGIWDDLLCRACLLGLTATLWLTLALADARVILPLVVFLPALYWRQRFRARTISEREGYDF